MLFLAQGEGFDVMKSGDARVALIGFPSVGKVSHMTSRSKFNFCSPADDSLLKQNHVTIYV